MKVYSLLGFVEYEGSRLVGVFGTLEGVIYCVESGNDIERYFGVKE